MIRLFLLLHPVVGVFSHQPQAMNRFHFFSEFEIFRILKLMDFAPLLKYGILSSHCGWWKNQPQDMIRSLRAKRASGRKPAKKAKPGSFNLFY